MHDTWNTVGMRATASNEFEVTDAQIPDSWVFDLFSPMRRDDPLYRLPMWFIVKHGGNTTALARRAIDEAIEAAQTKMVMPQRQLLIDMPDTLEAIARAEAATRSARDSWSPRSSGSGKSVSRAATCRWVSLLRCG